MQGRPQKAIEYINGSVPSVMKEYHDEAQQLISAMPKGDSQEPMPNVEESVRQLRDKVRMEQQLIERGNELLKAQKGSKKATEAHKKYNKVSDDVKMALTREYELNGKKIDIPRAVSLYGIKESTLRGLITKLNKGESILRKKVKTGRRCILTDAGAKLLFSLYDENKVDSDREAAKILNDDGIQISRRTVTRLMNNGFMEKHACCSLTCKRVYYRGANAESEENKTAREDAMAQLESLTSDHYHPVFIDETHWSVGWAWTRRRSRKGEKKIVCGKRKNYDITAISAISDNGPCYTTVFEGNTITADIFMSYMAHLLDQEINRKVVFFMDNAPVHPKKALNDLLKDMKDKKIIFNAPYSPECNPIEKFFAEWKQKVLRRCKTAPPPKTMIRYIEEAFMEFTSDNCTDLITNLKTKVLPKVVNHDDL